MRLSGLVISVFCLHHQEATRNWRHGGKMQLKWDLFLCVTFPQWNIKLGYKYLLWYQLQKTQKFQAFKLLQQGKKFKSKFPQSTPNVVGFQDRRNTERKLNYNGFSLRECDTDTDSWNIVVQRMGVFSKSFFTPYSTCCIPDHFHLQL